MKQRKPKTIVFIGFMHKTETITAAREAGYKTVCITKFPKLEKAQSHFDEVIEKDVTNLEELQEVIPYIRERYLVKSVITNYERFVVPRSYFAEHFGIPSCSIYSACCTRNKAMQRHALSFMKENIPYRIVRNRTEALLAYGELGPKVFLKSISGVKSKLIFGVESEDELLRAYREMLDGCQNTNQELYDPLEYCEFQFQYPDPRTTFLVEKAIEGQQISIDSVIGDYRIWHAPSVVDIYSHNGRGNAIRVLGSALSKEIQIKAKKAVSTAIRVLGMQHCAAHTELFITPDGDIKIIEIASRTGGFRPRMYELAYGLSLPDQLIKAVLRKEVKARRALKQYVAVTDIYPDVVGKLDYVEGLEEVMNDPQATDIVTNKPDNLIGPAKLGHESAMKFFVTGKTHKEVLEKCQYYQDTLKAHVKA